MVAESDDFTFTTQYASMVLQIYTLNKFHNDKSDESI